ncbi:SemiSWEET family sugar transporter [Spiroplasma endosymbiont of Danaus chrysippus]|uniref:SemiSWEET family sugar transporter n=1 Tax=Spiroplasma endosymbiont of Danaus chrysippus TaxID=2691041 RepID=UPI00157AC33C|nr:SemiSWEET family transporter [Spiroplasma endosymbiont of Danaus chrysippus]
MSNIAIDIIGYIGAFFISVAFLPQTIKLIKTKNTKGLSLISYSIYQIGLTSFIIYASLIKNIPLLAANAFGTVINIILLTLIIYNLYYNNKDKKNILTSKK